MFSFTFSCLCSQRIIVLIPVPVQQTPEGFLKTKSITCLFGLSKCVGLLESASANCFLLRPSFPEFSILPPTAPDSGLPQRNTQPCRRASMPSCLNNAKNAQNQLFFSPLLWYSNNPESNMLFLKSNKSRKGFSDGTFLPLVALQGILQLFSRMKIQKVFTLFRDFFDAGLQTMQNYKHIVLLYKYCIV